MVKDRQDSSAAAAAFEQQNAQLAAILQSSTDAITTMTPDGIILGWNAGAETMFGYSAAEVIGQPVKDLLLSAEARAHYQVYDPVRHGPDVSHHQAVRIRRDGTPIDVSFTVCPIADECGKLAVLSVIYRDRAAERRLQTSYDAAQLMFGQLVETSPFGVYAVDADFRLVHVGIGAREVFANVEPLIGRDMGDILRVLWSEPFATEAIGHFRKALDTGETYRSENTVEKRANIDAVEAYDWKVERVAMPDGRFGVVCHFYDLSERTAYEAALHDREDRLRVAIDGAELGAWTYDLTSGAIEWNDRARHILGITDLDEQVPIEIWGQRTHPDDLLRMQKIYHDALAEGRVFHSEHRIVMPSGELKWIDMHGQQQVGLADGASRITGVFSDITERKRSEEQIRLLMGEVNHRSKNLLAVVQAIAYHTAKDPAEKAYAERLSARIMALSASQDLMRVSEREGIYVAELVNAQLSGFVEDLGNRIRVNGPAARLSPAAAQTIGMALHELATNATRYGAFSNAEGAVNIGWSLGDDNTFSMHWTESAGPAVKSAMREGFGKMVVVNMLKLALQADVTLDYAPQGLVWKFTAPLKRVVESA